MNKINTELLNTLKNLIALHPAIVNYSSRPIGEPGSVARIEQDFAKLLIAEATAAIAKADAA